MYFENESLIYYTKKKTYTLDFYGVGQLNLSESIILSYILLPHIPRSNLWNKLSKFCLISESQPKKTKHLMYAVHWNLQYFFI